MTRGAAALIAVVLAPVLAVLIPLTVDYPHVRDAWFVCLQQCS
ncbi:hypothetical protein [Arthrobacter cheniae]|nr:hypothetical protein [Arthrobacter cheniae]